MKKPTYVIDSYALLAYLQAEPGGDKVKDLLTKARAGHALLILSLINLGEIVYIVGRRLGEDAAEETLRDILRLPIQLSLHQIKRVQSHLSQNALIVELIVRGIELGNWRKE